MIATTLTQAGIGLLVAVPSLILAFFAYRHSTRVDEIAAQAGISTAHTDSIGQVVDGLNKIVANLQEDNRVLREAAKDLNVRLNHIIAECEELKRKVAILGMEVKHST